VSPDGAWILYLESDAPKSKGAAPAARLMRMATAGGAPEKVFDAQPAAGFVCARAPAKLCVLSEVDGGQTVFTAFDPVKGRLRELTRTNQTFVWDLSPDGTRIARLTQPDSTAVIKIVSLVGDAETSVRLDRAVAAQQLAWAADGRSFYVVAVPRDRVWLLLRVAPDGHTTPLIPPQMWMYSAAASPDGKRIAYTSNTGQGNVWLLEGY
jgi:Tol biopolymer transport system component